MDKTLFKTIAITLAMLFFASCGNAPPDVILEKSGQAALVFVRENSRENNRSNAMRSNADEYYPGTDIFILEPISPQGDVRNLTAQYTRAGQSRSDRYGHACDPEVSYDGKKILFSMRKNRDSNWHLYEMDRDGGNLLQLTDQKVGDDMDPAYLPDGRIIFTSTRSQIVDEYERRTSPLLHVAERGQDGRLINIRQISFNQSHDANPMVHSSGKVFYSRWEHLGDPNKFPLFVIDPDGTRPFVLYGNHSPRESGSRVFLEPRELSDGGIVCSVMERNSPFEGGAIAVIDISKSDDNLTFITPSDVPFNNTRNDAGALYKTPHPLFDKSAPAGEKEKIVVAVSPLAIVDGQEEQVDYGLYVMNKDGSNIRMVFNDPDYNDIDPVPLLPRDELPAGIPQVRPVDSNVQQALNSGVQTGMFFDGNVYDRAPNDGQPRPNPNHLNKDGSSGEVRHVRVIEAIPLPRDRDRRGGDIGDTNFEKQRVIGYAPVRADGSFSIEVPANRSLHLQTLDENGLMLVNQMTWIQVMPGERRLCTGCHDSHDRDKIINDLEIQSDLSVLNRASGHNYASGFDNAVRVTEHAAARPDTIDFFDRLRPNRANTVQAVLDRNCVSCHGSGNPDAGLRLANLAEDRTPSGDDNGNDRTSVYDILMDDFRYRTADGGDDDLVTRRGARNSPLMWVLFNRQLDGDDDEFRALSYDHSTLWQKDGFGRIDPFLAANSDLLVLIEWIDLGAQYSNTIQP